MLICIIATLVLYDDLLTSSVKESQGLPTYSCRVFPLLVVVVAKVTRTGLNYQEKYLSRSVSRGTVEVGC